MRCVIRSGSESERLRFTITSQDMSYYGAHGWTVAPGLYRASVGSSERDLQAAGEFVEGR
jgi:fibronectin type III domain protein